MAFGAEVSCIPETGLCQLRFLCRETVTCGASEIGVFAPELECRVSSVGGNQPTALPAFFGMVGGA